MRAMIAGGVPAGAISPVQLSASNPGRNSPTVGSSGASEVRFALETARYARLVKEANLKLE